MESIYLGIILTLWPLLLYLGYLSLLPQATESGELEKKHSKAMTFIKYSMGWDHSGTIYIYLGILLMPVLFLGFTFGYFQSYMKDNSVKIFGYIVGALNLILIIAIIGYISDEPNFIKWF
ncbi:hypothetical protein [Kangiella spongicola]|uniref:Uncharacterized protein n=1 Tax=Kangiella spongicola TaxID=796379 RepID=A0A318D5V7_9GAMM|nr:hypothetical protein [Kangiella spongicola]PXF63168.1 hypothetical protein DL796_06895 [Kangiella spongicola]